MNPYAIPLTWHRSIKLAAAVALAAAMVLLALLRLLLGPPASPAQAQAGTDVIRVAPTGADTLDCGDAVSPCATVQYAVDQAQPGDEIRLATGIYTGVQARAGITQVVYLSKTVTIRGGYPPTDWSDPDPAANPTTLDAGGQGRVMVITGAISPTVEGLRLTGGDATGLGGHEHYVEYDAGGGVYAYMATATVSGCVIVSNTANTAYGGYGGGLYLKQSPATLQASVIAGNTASAGFGDGGGLYLDESDATLQHNIVQDNIASSAGAGGGLFLYKSAATLHNNTVQNNTAGGSFDGEGGGLYLKQSAALLQANTIVSNVASIYESGFGGGLFLHQSAAILQSNTIIHNIAGISTHCEGGGLYLYESNATLQANTIVSNTASTDFGGHGGGLYLLGSDALLQNNTFLGNAASASTAGWGWGYGGGLYLMESDARLEGNLVQANTAGTSTYGDGGGLYLSGGLVTLAGNTIVSNTATLSQTAIGRGGGLFVEYSPHFTLTNNLVADNHANTEGSGLWVGNESDDPISGNLLHTTIANNDSTGHIAGHGSGQGVYVGNHVTLALSNTIIAGHSSVGITVTAGGAARLEATLWYSNGANTGGAGVITNSQAITGDPAFAGGGDYHIGPGSAAIDVGVDAGLTTDIDGDPRPASLGYDLGADEWLGAFLQLEKRAGQAVVQPGDSLTYTILLANTGQETATNVLLSDTLPLYQRPLAVATDRGSCALGAGWGAPVTCNLGDVAVEGTAQISLSVAVTATQPGPFPFRMRNLVQARAANAANETFEDVYLQDCHVRINGRLPEYATVQAAVDAANQGDTLQVAGRCGMVHERAGLRQVVYLSKTLTIRGGYTTTNWTDPDPAANPATLDAGGQGRVMVITGAISPTVAGLRLTGGDATGLGGAPYGAGDAGGGLYVYTATATLSGCLLVSNTASTASDGFGGGLALLYSAARLEGNTVASNTASSADYGRGGGLYVYQSPAALQHNTVQGNVASTAYYGLGFGGGLYLRDSPATLQHNTVQDNIAGTGVGDVGWTYTYNEGGGLYIGQSAASLEANTVTGNTASTANCGKGGGLALYYSDASLSGNTVFSNTASSAYYGYGGGLYLEDSATSLSGNTVASNVASTDHEGEGGGLYLVASAATLQANTVVSNTASTSREGHGGGLYLRLSPAAATFHGNIIAGNTASTSRGGSGGGLYMYHSAATFQANTFISNIASTADSGAGGGLYLENSTGTLQDNTVASNVASTDQHGYGGGLSLYRSPATLHDNTIQANVASTAGEGHGGGLHINRSAATLQGNTVRDNTASTADEGFGGGLILWSSPATLQGNTVINNSASTSDRGDGGGLYLIECQARLDNNFVSDNQAPGSGAGLYVAGPSPRLRHNTIARNHGGDGSGIYATNYRMYPGALALTNTILISHSLGLVVTADSTATLEATLWGNEVEWTGPGTIVTGAVNVWGDPAFLAPDAGDYHLGPASAAIDRGVPTSLSTDVDGAYRPQGSAPDLGADEVPGLGLEISKYAPGAAQPGEPVTYTLTVENHGQVPVTGSLLITDVVPAGAHLVGQPAQEVISWVVDVECITGTGSVCLPWQVSFAVTASQTITNEDYGVRVGDLVFKGARAVVTLIPGWQVFLPAIPLRWIPDT